jgi:hypothetical protein
LRYGFTRTVAHVKVAMGVIIMVAGAVLAIVALAYPALVSGRQDLAYRVLSAALLLGAGAVIGTGFIVLGQLILVLLDIRVRLARIDRRLTDRKEPVERDSPLTERMRPRL